MSRADAALALPSEWESIPRSDGSTELRINRRGGLAAYVFGALSVIWFSILFGSWASHHGMPPRAERLTAIAPGLFLVALTAWCALAPPQRDGGRQPPSPHACSDGSAAA